MTTPSHHTGNTLSHTCKLVDLESRSRSFTGSAASSTASSPSPTLPAPVWLWRKHRPEALLVMGLTRYTRDQLEHLRNSPLVKKPEGLPDIAQWMESGSLSYLPNLNLVDPFQITSRRPGKSQGTQSSKSLRGRRKCRSSHTTTSASEPAISSWRPYMYERTLLVNSNLLTSL